MLEFHKSKQSAAVLKHSILASYIPPFATKTGSVSPGGRVAFIDGYAGPGRYEDGNEGSGAMLLKAAQKLAAMSSPRQLECYFVEAEPDTVARLREVAAEEGAGVTYDIKEGGISTHLPELLEAVQSIPLFVYLDPCGLPIPLEEVATIFERPGGLRAPATEVLINLTAGLRRFAGMLHSEKGLDLDKALKPLDRACGGDWWRAAWLAECPSRDAPEDRKMAAELAVVEGYAKRLREGAGNSGTWIIDVKPRAKLKPVYYLIFASRHRDGLIHFGESASKGLEYWRQHLAQQDWSDEDTLIPWEDVWKHEEETLKQQWIKTLTERLAIELAKGKPFKVIDRYGDVFGDLGGVAREMHLRQAMKNVRAAGLTTTTPVGVKRNLLELLLIPAQPPQ